MNVKHYFIYFLIGICSVFLFSCSTSKNTKSEDYIIYPSPPDTARIQYLISLSNSVNVTGNRSAFAKFVLGESELLLINKPYGISISNGKMFICDPGIGGLEIIDIDKGTFNYFIPKGKGQLKLPINCFVDNTGNLYISDAERKQIVLFDKDQNFITAFGEAENFKPTDVAVSGDKIFVTNSKNNKVNVYKKDSIKLLYSFPQVDQGSDGFLFQPTNICVSDDKVYVTDFGDFKIKIYSQDGKYISSVGSYGKNIGQFVRPKGLAVDKDANLYVIDAGFENTQIFNKNGQSLMFFGGPYKGPGDMWLPAKVTIDYENTKYFEELVDPSYDLKYLIFVTNQYGPDKINVYGYVEPAKVKKDPKLVRPKKSRWRKTGRSLL